MMGNSLFARRPAGNTGVPVFPEPRCLVRAWLQSRRNAL